MANDEAGGCGLKVRFFRGECPIHETGRQVTSLILGRHTAYYIVVAGLNYVRLYGGDKTVMVCVYLQILKIKTNIV